MALRTALPALLFAACISLTLAWKRIGLGRPIWAHAKLQDLILLSATGTLASINVNTGDINWRLPIAHSTVTVTPRAALIHEELILIALSNDRVRAVTIDGDILWEHPGCGLAYPPQAKVLPIAQCNSADHSFVDLNGNPMKAVEYEIRAVSDLDLLPSDLTWEVDDIVISSLADGLFRAERGGKLAWVREEGLAHPLDAAIYIDKAISVLVLLSELGNLFGIDSKDGDVVWKLKLDGNCRLHSEHELVAVVSCETGTGGTTAVAVEAASGKVLQRDRADNFVCIKATLEDTHAPIPLLRIVDKTGAEQLFFKTNGARGEEPESRPWLVYSENGSSISLEQSGTAVWNVNMPPSSRIVAVAKSQSLHPISSRSRPPAVRVTGDRRLLYKYVDANLVLVLAYDEKETETHALLIDSYRGVVHDAVTHPASTLPASAVKGESWFAYILWSTVTMQQELHIIDLYHHPRNISWVGKAFRDVIEQTLGSEVMEYLKFPTKQTLDQCPTGEPRSGSSQCLANDNADPPISEGVPYVVRSSSLLTQRVRSLDLTQTLLGLTEPAVIFTLESGQATLVSKFLLDARRPKEMNSAYENEYLPQYKPVISLQSHSRDSHYVDKGHHIPGLKTIAVAPHHTQESVCQIAVIGTDLVYSTEFPAGNFDSLPDDFFYSGVVGMILTLIILFFYTRGLNVKASLAQSW